MTWWKWSRTAASNSNADPTVNFAEGQAPSSLNDSNRAAMAAVAKFRDDIAGAITTGGSSTAYTLTTYGTFDALSTMDGKMVAFVPHTTNGATVTLNVDGLGAKALRSAPGSGNELGAGVLVQGTPYVATYFNSANEWVLHGFYGNPYNVPLGAMLDFTGTTAPNSNFVLPYGQAISRTTYATYFTIAGTTFGMGDGSTTFNVPDLRGRLVAGKDDMGGSAASRITTAGSSIDGTSLGAVGGAQNVTVAQANLPNVNFNVTIGAGQGSHNHTQQGTDVISTGQSGTANGGAGLTVTSGSGIAAATLPAMTGTAASGGSGTALNKMPPAIVLNKILRII